MSAITRSGAVVFAAMTVGAALGSPASHAEPPRQLTVVMVHGAWADTSSWDGEITALEHSGYRARAIANPLQNLITDADSVRSFLSTIDGPVVLVGHSYGGAVISQAAADSPNVKALVFVDAYAPEVGESASVLNGDGSAVVTLADDQLYDVVPTSDAADGSVDLLLKENVFRDRFASDLAPAQATQLWATQRATSTAALKTPTTEAAWKTIPSWAFISTGDQIITPAAKEFMARRANAQVTMFDGGSHLTLISHPDVVTTVIEQAAIAVS
jgi:pimeloyl-ACP methyl ester carboxylesterase